MKPTACVLALLLASSIAGTDAVFERPSDPGFRWQWDLENTGQPIRPLSEVRGTPDADIDAVEAFAAGHTGQGVLLALIGQGLSYGDGGLEPVLWRNPGEIPGNQRDDDENGLVDDVFGYDFFEHDPDPSFQAGHDRAVADIAVAPHDGHSIAGIAPGARLMILKIGDSQGRIRVEPLQRALNYAADEGARVIFMPWSSSSASCLDLERIPLHLTFEMISQRALIIGGLPGQWPACDPHVVSVQATGPDDRPKRGPQPDIDFAAPGANGRSEVYTSNAIGEVAGAAALLFAQDPTRSPAQVRELLARSADRVHPELSPYVEGRSALFGAGRINLARALGTDFDGDGVLDSDDPDADGDGIADVTDPCPLHPGACEPADQSP